MASTNGKPRMSSEDLALMAHLMRRAGFGEPRDGIEAYVAKGYEATVEELLHLGDHQAMPDDLIRRYHSDLSDMKGGGPPPANWLYRMVTTKAPLQEKIALFWHGIFATGFSKITNGKDLMDQIQMFRRYGLGSFQTLLLELSKDPSMIIWLDNHDNHNGAINENYGRELLELFSMGVGNYTEQDIKECARAFTGWTIGNTEYMVECARNNSTWPYGRIAMHSEYRPEDHDDGEKVFLDQRGRFNGEDVIDIICQQPATARFISRHMYSFFVADEPPVPQWPYVPPRDPEAIETLSQTYFESHYDVRSMLRVLFNSDFFRSEKSWYEKVKSPAELVVGVLRLSGGLEWPQYEIPSQSGRMAYMGQALTNPPSVEGWHQGVEWIDSGALVERVNFATEHLGDLTKLGVRAIIDRLEADYGGVLSPDRLVQGCLDLMGAISVSENTRSALVEHASRAGDLRLSEPGPGEEPGRRVAEMVQLVATTPEFQRA